MKMENKPFEIKLDRDWADEIEKIKSLTDINKVLYQMNEELRIQKEREMKEEQEKSIALNTFLNQCRTTWKRSDEGYIIYTVYPGIDVSLDLLLPYVGTFIQRKFSDAERTIICDLLIVDIAKKYVMEIEITCQFKSTIKNDDK